MNSDALPTAGTGRAAASEVVVVDDDDDNTPPAPPTSAPRDLPLEQLEKALENTCETLHSLATNVLDFSYDSQNVLFTKVNEFVRDLREVDSRAKLVSASVPMDVLEAIDKGRNPDLCTYQMLESSAEASGAARGKLAAMRQFRDEMDKCLREAGVPPMPEDDSGVGAGISAPARSMDVDTGGGDAQANGF